MENDKKLFIAFYFWGGYHNQSVWQEIDRVIELADKFVLTYDQNKTWEDESFEEFMHEFIIRQPTKL
jgi:hypothetical protein